MNKTVTSSYYLFKELGPSGLKDFQHILGERQHIFNIFVFCIVYTYSPRELYASNLGVP